MTLTATVIAVMVAAAGAGCVYLRLRHSLPLLNGERPVDGLKHPVRIERDAAGVPNVSGASRADVAFGLGFLHAQERFFQMDLSRRAAAGELAELLGKRFLDFDRGARVHRFRQKAEKIAASVQDDQRALLVSYSSGVSAGLRALRKPTLEYMLLKATPADWQPADTILVLFHMYRSLQDDRAEQDYSLYLLYDALPASVADFLTPIGSADWDAPIVGEPPLAAATPGPEVIDFRNLRPERIMEASRKRVRLRGSNVWGVSAAVSGTGHAVIANDIHLRFGMPPLFYRATLEFIEPTGRRRLSGITLPGFPFIVAGTNGDIAWGVANAEVDSVDLVRLDQTNLPPDAYRTLSRLVKIETAREIIHVKGQGDDVLDIRTTPWGPITRQTSDGIQFAQSWTAYGADGANLEWDKLETSRSVGEAMEAANRVGVPTLAVVMADRHGDVGWTLAGPLRPRSDVKGKLPTVSSQIEAGADVPVELHSYPRLASPEFDRVWSANARPVAGCGFDPIIGNGYFSLGARALQIRDCLLNTAVADERKMLDIQLDVRALFLSRWRELLERCIEASSVAEIPKLNELQRVLRNWDGRAAADSAAYRLVRRFRSAVERLAFEPFVSVVSAKHGKFELDCTTDQLEEPLWRLVVERPDHLLAPWFTTWNDLLLAAIQEVLAAIPQHVSIESYVWGDENKLVMRHPLSAFVPLLGYLFDAPSSPLDGDIAMPLVQTPRHGPVVRLVITPGREDQALLQMPGGQAGNPLAPYYLAGHKTWLEGTPAPLLPGPACYFLTLLPTGPS